MDENAKREAVKSEIARFFFETVGGRGFVTSQEGTNQFVIHCGERDARKVLIDIDALARRLVPVLEKPTGTTLQG